jgi:lipopolysaccharide export system protein LptA
VSRSISRCRQFSAAAVLVVALTFGVTEGIAQSDKQSPIFKGLAQNRNEPVKIAADSLEVRDKDKKATFSGNVHVVQGDVELRCNTLIVYYESEAAKGGSKAPKAQPGGPTSQSAAGNQQIRRMEAIGSVQVMQKEQRATGDRAEFDMRKNSVTLSGNVVVSRGDDVLRGHLLYVDLTSGVSKMESGGGRVEGIIKPSPGQNPIQVPPKQGRPN